MKKVYDYFTMKNITSDFLKEIHKIPLLSIEEEQALGERIKKGDQKAVEKLIYHNLRLLPFVASWYQYCTEIPFLDLCQEGFLGLRKAAETFTAEKWRFYGLAVLWIQSEIKKTLKTKESYFKRTGTFYKEHQKIRRKKYKLTKNLDWNPSIEEIGEELMIPKERVELIENIFYPLEYTDVFWDENQKEAWQSFVTEDMEEKIIERLDSKNILSILSERNKKIIEMLYGLNGEKERETKEIADFFGVTSPRIYKIKKNELKRLKEYLTQKREEEKETKEPALSYIDIISILKRYDEKSFYKEYGTFYDALEEKSKKIIDQFFYNPSKKYEEKSEADGFHYTPNLEYREEIAFYEINHIQNEKIFSKENTTKIEMQRFLWKYRDMLTQETKDTLMVLYQIPPYILMEIEKKKCLAEIIKPIYEGEKAKQKKKV